MKPIVHNKRMNYPMPKGAVYVGRPSKWGNPFHVDAEGRAFAIANFRRYLDDNAWLKEAAKKELRGKDLICWCAPEACHADILLEIANEEPPLPSNVKFF